MSTTSQTKIIVDALGDIISSELSALSSEYWQPQYGADQMDAELKFRKERIERLRAMRAEFENIMFGLGKEVV